MVESQLICEESEMQEKSKVTMKIVFVPLILSMSVEYVLNVKDTNFLIQQFKDANKSVIQDMFTIWE